MGWSNNDDYRECLVKVKLCSIGSTAGFPKKMKYILCVCCCGLNQRGLLVIAYTLMVVYRLWYSSWAGYLHVLLYLHVVECCACALIQRSHIAVNLTFFVLDKFLETGSNHMNWCSTPFNTSAHLMSQLYWWAFLNPCWTLDGQVSRRFHHLHGVWSIYVLPNLRGESLVQWFCLAGFQSNGLLDES